MPRDGGDKEPDGTAAHDHDGFAWTDGAELDGVDGHAGGLDEHGFFEGQRRGHAVDEVGGDAVVFGEGAGGDWGAGVGCEAGWMPSVGCSGLLDVLDL